MSINVNFERNVCCLNDISPKSLMKVVRKYIPPQLLSKIDPEVIEKIERGGTIYDGGVSIARTLLDNSKFHLRMHGSAEDLAASLDKFADFPMQYDYFDFSFDEDLATNPVECRTMDNRRMISKHDLIFYCYGDLIGSGDSEQEGTIRFFLAMRWKVHLAKQKQFEAISVEQLESDLFIEKLDAIPEEVDRRMSEVKPTSGIMNSLDRFIKLADPIISLSEFLNELNDSERNDFVKFVEQVLARRSSFLTATLFSNLLTAFKTYDAILEKLPYYFSPRPQNGKRCVRVYQNINRNVVLLPELENDGSTDIGNCLYLETITYENALKRPSSKDVEFVLLPLKTATYSAIPIMVTPGKFFKFAIDVFFELFRELIFCYKIFQARNPPSLETFFNGLEEFFDAEKTNGMYMINLKLEPAIREYVSTYFEPIRGQQLKDVRNAKADGYTVDNLKNELKNLGVVETLPDILTYCETVYEHIDRRKAGKVLRTCDLFRAVELCQLNAVIRLFPNLGKFFHSQSSCTRVFFLNCTGCETSTLPRKYQNSVWRDVKLSEVSLKDLKLSNDGTKVVTKKMRIPDGLELYNNNTAFLLTMTKFIELTCKESMVAEQAKFTLMGNWENFRFEHFLVETKDITESLRILMDKYPDHKWLNDVNFVRKNMFLNLDDYCRHVQNKTFYLRTFSTSAVQEEKQRRVSRTEVLKLVVTVFNTNNSKSLRCATNFVAPFKKYCKLWEIEKNFETISLDGLKSFLEELDFDKSLITLVPDITYASTVLESLLSISGNGNFLVPGFNYQMTLSFHEAQFQIFQYIICEIDWNVEVCRTHSDCKKKLRDNIMKEMRNNAGRENGHHFLEIDIIVQILKFRKHCNFLKRLKYPTPIVNLFGADFNDAISVAYFLSECEKYRLSKFNYQTKAFSKEQLAEAVIPVWKARILFMLGWADMFFDEANDDLKTDILKSLMWRVPLLKWDSEEDFMNVLLGTSEKKLQFAKNIAARNAVEYQPLLIHPCFPSVPWKSQTYIIRCQKWAEHEPVRQLLEKGLTLDNQEEVQKLLNKAKLAIEKNLKKEKGKNAELEDKSLKILREIVKEEVTHQEDQKPVTTEKEVSQNGDCKVLEAALQKNTNLKSQIEEQKSIIEKLRKESDVQNKAMKEVTANMDKSKEESKKNREEKEKLSAEVRTKEKQIQELRKERDAQNKSMKDVTATMNKSKEELKKNREQKERLSAEVRTKDKQIEELKKEITGQKRTAESIAKTNKLSADSRDAAIRKLTKEHEDAQKLAKIEASKKEELLKEKDSEIANLKRALEEQKLNASKSLEKLNAKISCMENELCQAQVVYQQSGVKDVVINQLRQENTRLHIMNDTKEGTIQSLLDRIASNPAGQIQNRRSELSAEMKSILRELQHTRDTLLKEQTMKQATDTAQRLINMAEEPTVKNAAKMELKRFHSMCRGYFDAVESSIEMIQKNVEITREQLPPLPEFPTFSDTFMCEYEKVEKKVMVPEGELADPECLICLQNMTDGQTIKCCHCKRRYHSECATDWLKVKSVCPACNGGLLDPEEFPSLG